MSRGGAGGGSPRRGACSPPAATRAPGCCSRAQAPAPGLLRRAGGAARAVLHGARQRHDRRRRARERGRCTTGSTSTSTGTAPTCGAGWCRRRRPRRRRGSATSPSGRWCRGSPTPAHRSGPLSAMFLALSVGPLGRRLIAEPIRLKHVGPAALPARRAPAQRRSSTRRAPSASRRGFLWQNRVAKMRLPGFFLRNPARRYGLEYHAEQLPAPRQPADARRRRPTGSGCRGCGSTCASRDGGRGGGGAGARRARRPGSRRNRLGAARATGCRAAARVAAVLAEARHGNHQVGTIRMGCDRRSGGGRRRLPRLRRRRTSTWSRPRCCRPRARPTRR